jgi:hypothetical protein
MFLKVIFAIHLSSAQPMALYCISEEDDYGLSNEYITRRLLGETGTDNEFHRYSGIQIKVSTFVLISG